jgi:NAD(P)-dependent dehydrogenase (short-subunit alcohol dehydrogenase family)
VSKNSLESIFRINGEVVVITGAAGLLGRQHAEAVAAFGGTPVLLDLPNTPVKKLAEQLKDRYQVPAQGMFVDITNEKSVAHNSEHLVKQFGHIYGLINNAANNPKMEEDEQNNFSRLENFPIDIWSQDMSVGLTGAFLCAKHFGTAIAQNPEGGSIVNISSDLGLIAPDQRLYLKDDLSPEQQPTKPISYSVIKAGLIGLTRYLSTYWVDKGVRCNAICPGGVENDQPTDFLREVCSRIPMGRLARPNEYQGVIVFMLSKASSYLNGAVIPIDGGRSSW